MAKKKKTINIKHPGALHAELGIPQGQKIPYEKLLMASHSSDETLRKRAQFALNAKEFDHTK